MKGEDKWDYMYGNLGLLILNEVSLDIEKYYWTLEKIKDSLMIYSKSWKEIWSRI
jgi:hypothetical protein